MSERISVVVPDGAAGSRADRYMADACGLSRSYVQRLIADGALTCEFLEDSGAYPAFIRRLRSFHAAP